MKAAIVTGTENVDEHLHVVEDWPKPTLATAVDGKTGKLVSELREERHLIVKVIACALAPGDCRLFTGKTDLMQLPKFGRPYVLGSDVCGIVTEVDATEEYFSVGDKVVARFDEPQPNGMCAEFACVKASLSEKCSLPALQACTLPASAAAARLVALKFIQPKHRVLLLGGSGGVGTFFVQYAKLQGASFVAATSTQSELLQSLGVDRVIDYRTENWWELDSEFQEQPFDVVVDLVNGSNWTLGACSKVLKGKETTYVQLMTGVETEVDARGLNVVPFIFGILRRRLESKFFSNRPNWTMPQGLDLQPGDLKAILEDVAEGGSEWCWIRRVPFRSTRMP